MEVKPRLCCSIEELLGEILICTKSLKESGEKTTNEKVSLRNGEVVYGSRKDFVPKVELLCDSDHPHNR